MKNLIFITLVVWVFASCKENAEPNQLSKKEIKEGWELLFDGKTMDKWKGYCKENVPAAWSVTEDGTMHISGSGKGEAGAENGGDIITREKYENFELSLEWKVSEGGNSGIFYLARETCGFDTIPGDPIWKSSLEMQIIDNEKNPDAKLGIDGNHQAGSLYDLIAAKPQSAKPANEWNEIRITVYKGTVIHWMNGKNILEYHLWTKDWKAMCAKSKFAEFPDFVNTAETGYIGLQDHGDDVWFRNIKIRKL
jgi:hypothetical protein